MRIKRAVNALKKRKKIKKTQRIIRVNRPS